jgi:hypothetical protein
MGRDFRCRCRGGLEGRREDLPDATLGRAACGSRAPQSTPIQPRFSRRNGAVAWQGHRVGLRLPGDCWSKAVTRRCYCGGNGFADPERMRRAFLGIVGRPLQAIRRNARMEALSWPALTDEPNSAHLSTVSAVRHELGDDQSDGLLACQPDLLADFGQSGSDP